MHSLTVQVFQHSRQPFCDLLREHGIEFSERLPRPGVVMASGGMLEILYAVGGTAAVLAPVAKVLVAWLKSRSSRKVIITTNRNETVHKEGMPVEDVERILNAAKTLAVIDTKAPDKPAATRKASHPAKSSSP